MTAVSTKVPASRSNGAPMAPPGGPVPMPRVVGNRRLRTGGIALATMLLAFGAALSGIALLSVAKTSAYLGVRQDVPVGALVQAADLTSVQLSGGSGLTLIPAADIRQVVGKHAAVELRPGTLLSPTELNDRQLVPSGDAQMGIVVKSTALPGQVTAGEQVTLVPLATIATGRSGSGAGNGNANAATSIVAPTSNGGYPVTVVDISAPSADGSMSMHIALPTDLVYTIASLNSGGWNVVFISGN
jgi:hypothetical protein